MRSVKCTFYVCPNHNKTSPLLLSNIYMFIVFVCDCANTQIDQEWTECVCVCLFILYNVFRKRRRLFGATLMLSCCKCYNTQKTVAAFSHNIKIQSPVILVYRVVLLHYPYSSDIVQYTLMIYTILYSFLHFVVIWRANTNNNSNKISWFSHTYSRMRTVESRWEFAAYI